MKKFVIFAIILCISCIPVSAQTMIAHDWEFGSWSGMLFDAFQKFYITHNGGYSYTLKATAESASAIGPEGYNPNNEMKYDYTTRVIITYADATKIDNSNLQDVIFGDMVATVDSTTITADSSKTEFQCDSRHDLKVTTAPVHSGGVGETFQDAFIRIKQYYNFQEDQSNKTYTTINSSDVKLFPSKIMDVKKHHMKKEVKKVYNDIKLRFNSALRQSMRSDLTELYHYHQLPLFLDNFKDKGKALSFEDMLMDDVIFKLLENNDVPPIIWTENSNSVFIGILKYNSSLELYKSNFINDKWSKPLRVFTGSKS